MIIRNIITVGVLIFALHAQLFCGELAKIDRDLLKNMSVTELQNKERQVLDELRRLPHYNLSNATEPVGYRSPPHASASKHEWLELKLAQAQDLGEIILIPCLYRKSSGVVSCEGFPVEFTLRAGGADDKLGNVVAAFRASPTDLPRIAPLILPISASNITWIRLETVELSPREWDHFYVLQLSEIMLFDKNTRQVFPQQVSLPSDIDGGVGYHQNYLIDLIVPYQMNSPMGKASIAYVAYLRASIPSSLIIDLEADFLIDRVQFHLVEVSDTFPQSCPNGFGLPTKMKMEGSLDREFSQPELLLNFQKKAVAQFLNCALTPSKSRFVRLTIEEPYVFDNGVQREKIFGLAEIEIFSNNQNVAIGKKFLTTMHSISTRPASLLTDNHNFFGEIIPIRAWMHHLNRRHELEILQPWLKLEIERKYSLQKNVVEWLSWAVAIFFGLVMVQIYRNKISRERAVAKACERIAADLHDELGASLDAMALLGGMVQSDASVSPETQSLIKRLTSLAERASVSAKYCTNLLQHPEYYNNTLNDMKSISAKMTQGIEHSSSFENEDALLRLSPRSRLDLYLFYKECLTNIIRHSGATKVSSTLNCIDNVIRLEVIDNGVGLSQKTSHPLPPSLKRRARLLGAKVFCHSMPQQGTTITLTLNLKRKGFHLNWLWKTTI